MEREELLKVLRKKKNGQFFKITYITEPKINLDAKKSLTLVQKIVTKTVRTGVNYANLKAVKAAGGVSEKQRTPWYTWDLSNTLARHKENGTEYLCVATMEHGQNTKVQWRVNGKVVDEETAGMYVLHGTTQKRPPIQFIKLENIINIK